MAEAPRIVHRQLFTKKPTVFRRFCIVRTELSSKADSKPTKQHAFVTVGATATFDGLVRAVLNPAFLKHLSAAGYTNLVVQHGKDHHGIVDTFNKAHPPGCGARHGIWIETFDFKQGGLFDEFIKAQGRPNDAKEGVVISHVGTGSVLEALRAGVPIIAVPNPSLLDNHQAELADALDSAKLAVRADVDDLSSAIAKIESRRGKRRPLPSKNGADASGRGITGVLDEEMGFVD